jgi:hypothetical protein
MNQPMHIRIDEDIKIGVEIIPVRISKFSGIIEKIIKPIVRAWRRRGSGFDSVAAVCKLIAGDAGPAGTGDAHKPGKHAKYHHPVTEHYAS